MGEIISPHLVAQLASWGLSMRGKIVSRQKCPACGQAGSYELKDFGRGRRALLCRCGGFIANRLEVVVKWQGMTYRITHDQVGQRLTDYVHAERAQGLINNQIERKDFYPALWTSAKHNRLLWENYLRDYLADEEARLLPERKATLSKKKAWARHLTWFNGRNLRELRTADVERFATLPCLRLALAPKSLADLLVELRHILERAEARDDIERAPQVPSVQLPRRAVRIMTADQQTRVLERIPAPHRPIFLFLMEYGCRVSEACALCWDMVDREREVVILARTFSLRSLAEATKTRRDNTLPIVGWFQTYLEGRPTGLHQTPVFQNPEAHANRNPARFYYADALNRIWRSALEAEGLEHLPLKNGTRHSRGKQLRDAGWDPHLIARLLGHASTHHTMRYYVEDDAETLRKKLTAGKIVNHLSTRKGQKAGSQPEGEEPITT